MSQDLKMKMTISLTQDRDIYRFTRSETTLSRTPGCLSRTPYCDVIDVYVGLAVFDVTWSNILRKTSNVYS